MLMCPVSQVRNRCLRVRMISMCTRYRHKKVAPIACNRSGLSDTHCFRSVHAVILCYQYSDHSTFSVLYCMVSLSALPRIFTHPSCVSLKLNSICCRIFVLDIPSLTKLEEEHAAEDCDHDSAKLRLIKIILPTDLSIIFQLQSLEEGSLALLLKQFIIVWTRWLGTWLWLPTVQKK